MPYTNVRMHEGKSKLLFFLNSSENETVYTFWQGHRPVVGVADIVCRRFCCCCCAVRLLSASAARLAWLIEQHPEKFLWEKYLLHSCQSQRIYFVQQGDWPENRLATRLPTVVKTCIRATPLRMNVQMQNGSKKLLKISTFVSWLLAYEKTLTFTNSTAGE